MSGCRFVRVSHQKPLGELEMDNCEATTAKTNDMDSSTSLTGGRILPQYTAAIIGKQKEERGKGINDLSEDIWTCDLARGT
jgi:hypothetical protein